MISTIAWCAIALACAMAASEMYARGEYLAAGIFIVAAILFGYFAADDIREGHRHDRRS